MALKKDPAHCGALLVLVSLSVTFDRLNLQIDWGSWECVCAFGGDFTPAF